VSSEQLVPSPHFAISKSPAFVGRAVAAFAPDPEISRWNGQSLSRQLAKICDFTELDGSQPDDLAVCRRSSATLAKQTT
jgi:hypothetical protein